MGCGSSGVFLDGDQLGLGALVKRNIAIYGVDEKEALGTVCQNRIFGTAAPKRWSLIEGKRREERQT